MISYIVHADNMNSIRVHNLKNKRMNKDSNKKTNNCYNIFHLYRNTMEICTFSIILHLNELH